MRVNSFRLYLSKRDSERKRVILCFINFLFLSSLRVRQFAQQPRSGKTPIAFDGFGRDFQNFGDFLVRQSAEIFQFDDARFTFVELG